MLIDQRVAIANVDVGLPVHKGGNLGDFGKAVFFFDTVNCLVILGDVGLFMLCHQGFELGCQLIQKVSRTAGVINRFGRRAAVLDQALQRQTHQNKTANRHGREVLPLALLHALIEKALEHVA